MFIFEKKKLINIFIALIPLSIILGNLAININIILICFLGIYIYKNEIFFIEKKFYQYLIYFFFIYLIFITAINNFPNIKENLVYKTNLIKSIFYLRFLFLFLIINKLIENKDFNLKLFFYSAAFFSLVISVDLTIQAILGKNLIGYKTIQERPSSFFREELIAGGYLQKYILFFIFFCAYKIKKNYKILAIFLLFFIPIVLSGNKMPALIYFSSILFYLLIQKKLKLIFISIIFFIFTIFLLIKSQFNDNLNAQIINFGKDSIVLLTNVPKLFFSQNNSEKFEFGHTGYLIHFNSGIQLWKENKIFGNGLKSFPLNCKYIDFQQTCNSHPHNYFIEILVDTGLVGLLVLYIIFINGLFSYFKYYLKESKNNFIFFTLPFFLIIFFEFFPIRSSGSFFTTMNSITIFLILAFFINLEKIKNLIK